MSSPSPRTQRITALHRRIGRSDPLCSGNLRRRYTVCGTKNCSCKADPPEPHGPYFYWSRLLGGKVVQRVLSQDQARIVGRGIENYKKVKGLLRQWEGETVRHIDNQRRHKP